VRPSDRAGRVILCRRGGGAAQLECAVACCHRIQQRPRIFQRPNRKPLTTFPKFPRGHGRTQSTRRAKPYARRSRLGRRQSAIFCDTVGCNRGENVQPAAARRAVVPAPRPLIARCPDEQMSSCLAICSSITRCPANQMSSCLRPSLFNNQLTRYPNERCLRPSLFNNQLTRYPNEQLSEAFALQ